MRATFEELVSRCARSVGIEITRHRPYRTAEGRLAAALKANRIENVLDVGANVGQFARAIRQHGYNGRIVSFEPISECHEMLLRISARDHAWTIAPRVALSNSDSTAFLNVSANSVSSSLLPMRSILVEAEPRARYEGKQEVKTGRLDSLSPEYMKEGVRTLLKIDAQGSESAILEGAEQTLQHVTGLKIEISLVALYEGAPDGLELVRKIESMGFELWGLEPGFVDARTGRMLQLDGLFFRLS